MYNYEYKGTYWRFFHLDVCTAIPLKDRDYLCEQAAEMYIDKERKRTVKTENLEGMIKSTGKSFTTGALFGKLFEGEIETDLGKQYFSFLASQKANPQWN